MFWMTFMIGYSLRISLRSDTHEWRHVKTSIYFDRLLTSLDINTFISFDRLFTSLDINTLVRFAPHTTHMRAFKTGALLSERGIGWQPARAGWSCLPSLPACSPGQQACVPARPASQPPCPLDRPFPSPPGSWPASSLPGRWSRVG